MAETPGATPTESTAQDAAAPTVPEVLAAPTAPPAAAAPVAAKPANLAVGIAAGFGLGLVAALIYAAVTVLSEREFLWLGLLIGFAIAFGFSRFGHTSGVVPGLIAAVIAAVMYVVAIFVQTAGFITKELDMGFLDSLRLALEYPKEVLTDYFDDPLGYVFAGITVVMAFYYAWGGRKTDNDDAQAVAAAS